MNEHNTHKLFTEALLNKKFKEAEKIVIDDIKNNKLNAQLWLDLGEALRAQGYGKSARKVFDRALLLDPKAVWVDSVETALKDTPPGTLRKDIEELLKFEKVKVCAALIVKNEEKYIDKCLNHIKKAVDEIVIIDTGSTDDTINIINKHKNVKLYNFEWCDDFAAARNFALDKIESDWVLWIDADEFLLPEDVQNVKKAAGIFNQVTPTPVLRIGILNKVSTGLSVTYDPSRMFPTKKNLIFSGRIHEQIIDKDKGLYDTLTFRAAVRIRVLHEGYSDELMTERNKLDRNLNLLQKMIDDEPTNPAWYFFYARETFVLGNYDKAIEYFNLALEKVKLQPNFGRIEELKAFIIKCYFIKNELDLAESICKDALKDYPDYPDFNYLFAAILVKKSEKLRMEAGKYLDKCLALFETYRGIITPDSEIVDWKADLLRGDIALQNADLVTARTLYTKVSKLQPHINIIKEKLAYIQNQQSDLNITASSNSNHSISDSNNFDKAKPLSLHLGCGKTKLNGWINIDKIPSDAVDLVLDLDNCQNSSLPFNDNSVEEIFGNHFLDYISNPIILLQELHRVSKPDAKAVFRIPYGSSDDSIEDPSQVKQYFLQSFGFFSQPFYWKEDIGYKGDWLTEKITLFLDEKKYSGKSTNEIFEDINKYRNVVKEIIVEMKAIKPIRLPKKELQVSPSIEIRLV